MTRLAARAGTILVLGLGLAAAGCKGETAGRTLSGSEIQQLFSGKTVTGHHDRHGYSFESYYEPTGTFRSYQDGAKTPRQGQWWVAQGDDICVRWLDTSEELCRKMVTDGKGHFRKVLLKADGSRVLIVTFKSFENGNGKGL